MYHSPEPISIELSNCSSRWSSDLESGLLLVERASVSGRVVGLRLAMPSRRAAEEGTSSPLSSEIGEKGTRGPVTGCEGVCLCVCVVVSTIIRGYYNIMYMYM